MNARKSENTSQDNTRVTRGNIILQVLLQACKEKYMKKIKLLKSRGFCVPDSNKLPTNY